MTASTPLREAVDSAPQLVVTRQVLALGTEAVLALGQLAAAMVDLADAALQLGEFEQPGLIEVDQTASFGAGGLELAVEPAELGGEQLVVRCRDAQGERRLAGVQHVGADERGPHLVEDEGVEDLGPDVALGAAPVLTAGLQCVV